MTIQVALTLLDPDNYPSLTRARKACRKGDVLIHRGPIISSANDQSQLEQKAVSVWSSSNQQQCQRGRVGDVVFPGDVIGIPVVMGTFKK